MMLGQLDELHLAVPGQIAEDFAAAAEIALSAEPDEVVRGLGLAVDFVTDVALAAGTLRIGFPQDRELLASKVGYAARALFAFGLGGLGLPGLLWLIDLNHGGELRIVGDRIGDKGVRCRMVYLDLYRLRRGDRPNIVFAGGLENFAVRGGESGGKALDADSLGLELLGRLFGNKVKQLDDGLGRKGVKVDGHFSSPV